MKASNGHSTTAAPRMTWDQMLDARSRVKAFPLVEEALAQIPMFSMGTPAPEPINRELAGQLSPSQIRQWRDCQASWYFQRVRELPTISRGDSILGRAVHKALERNFVQKIESKVDLDIEVVDMMFREALSEEASGPVLWSDGETPVTAATEGAGLVAKYMAEAAHTIQPAAAETLVTGMIGGVAVRGYIDLLDVDGRIIDVKTAAKKPSGIRPDYAVQLATYAILEPKTNGQVQLDTLVKTKTPQLIRTEHTVTPADKQFAERLYPLAQEGMRTGLYYPNRESFFCSRRSCSYWAACEKEYGGEVKP